MSEPSQPSPAHSASALLSIRDTALSLGIAETEFEAMVEAVERGEDFSDYMGTTPEVLASFENVAVTFYGQHRYQDAEGIFGLLLQITNGTRGSAWRGLGACRQVKLDYPAAIDAYRHAIMLDASDLLSATYMAECLLLVGRNEEAVQVLTACLQLAPEIGMADAPHVRRAKALLEGAKDPARVTPSVAAVIDVSKGRAAPAGPTGAHAGAGGADARRNSAPAPSPKAAARANDPSPPTDDEVYDPQPLPEPDVSDPELKAFLERPHVREKLGELSNMLASNQITLREIADFSQEQIDAGHAVCYSLLERKEYAMALEMCGWMIHIDGHDYRFYQLGGLAALGVELHCLAEYLFAMAIIWSPGGADAATLVYKAEALLLQGELEEGLRLVDDGLEKAQGKPEFNDIVQRGKLLKSHYSAPGARSHATGDTWNMA